MHLNTRFSFSVAVAVAVAVAASYGAGNPAALLHGWLNSPRRLGCTCVVHAPLFMLSWQLILGFQVPFMRILVFGALSIHELGVTDTSGSIFECPLEGESPED